MPGLKPDPACPCGSAVTAVTCRHDAAAEARIETLALQLKTAEVSAYKAMLELALTRFGRPFLVAAWNDFFLGDDRGRKPLQEIAELASMFLPWFVLEFVRDPYGDPFDAAWPDEPIGLVWLRHRAAGRIGAGAGSAASESSGPATRDLEREWTLAACASPLAVLSVTNVEPGRWLDALDLLTRRSFRVRDATVAGRVHAGEFLFARVVTVRGVSRLIDLAPVVFRPSDRRRVLGLRNRWIGFRARSRQDLLDANVEMRSIYFELTSDPSTRAAHLGPHDELDESDDDDEDVEWLTPPEITPERQARMDDYSARRLAAWPEEPIDALGGLSPLEAAHVPELRGRLAAIVDRHLKAVERKGANSVNAERLRERLGLKH